MTPEQTAIMRAFEATPEHLQKAFVLRCFAALVGHRAGEMLAYAAELRDRAEAEELRGLAVKQAVDLLGAAHE